MINRKIGVNDMTKLSLPLGDRIRKVREEFGFTQGDLAKKAGLGPGQIISQIEKGQREIKAYELVRLSRVLNTDLYGLLLQQDLSSPQLLWRNNLDPEFQKMKEREFVNRCQEYHGLEELCEFKPQRNLPRFDIDIASLNFNTANRLANDCSNQLNLGSRPATCLERLLENAYGVKIWFMDLSEKGSAACVKGPFGPAILMNKTEAPWRRNYSFAHELFHLITWESLPPSLLKSQNRIWQKVEKVAEVFASNLLLPADSILAAFNERVSNHVIKYIDLIGIAREFDVSTQALLYRLLNLKRLNKKLVENLLNDPKFKEIDVSTIHQHWWDPPEIPERFVRLGFLGYKKGMCSRARLSSYLQVSLLDLSEFLHKYGLSEEEDYQADIATA